MHKPSWFKDNEVIVSTAKTCGINKDGHDLYIIDKETGKRTLEIDDQLAADVDKLLSGKDSPTIQNVDAVVVKTKKTAVPIYYDHTYHELFTDDLKARFPNFKSATIGSLVESGDITVRKGHGSPSADLRRGEVPYIKVSDLRAGGVNINATNLIPRVVAERFWRGKESGLKAFDLLSPERASKNIGDFCVLMPGQEQVVLTKEVLVFRVGPKAKFDQFYLLWALSLVSVRKQWERIVFMQTNREDVGNRFLELEIPVPQDEKSAEMVSAEFKEYFMGIAGLRSKFSTYLSKDKLHHFHLGE